MAGSGLKHYCLRTWALRKTSNSATKTSNQVGYFIVDLYEEVSGYKHLDVLAQS